jgi:hypothetical protein
MKKIFLLIIGLIVISGCSRKSLPLMKSSTVVTERLIPVPIPADSSLLTALFACDSLNNVYLKALSEVKGNNIKSFIELSNGQFQYKTKYMHDTLYVKTKDSLVYKDIPVPAPYEVEKRLSGFQLFLVWSGAILWVILLMSVGLKILTRWIK